MDVIIFACPRSVLYRCAGEHGFRAGEGGVLSVCTVDMERPMPARCVQVGNVSGRFVSALETHAFKSVLQRGRPCFGYHKELLHADGTLYLYGGSPALVHFKGCQGAAALQRIADTLGLDSASARVHMGVLGARLGRCVDTTHCSHFEEAVARRFRSVRVVGRMFDMNLTIRLHITRFDDAELPAGAPPLPPDLAPSSIDITVSGRGTVLYRMSWTGCDWTPEAEARVVAFCEALTEAFRGCC